MVDNDNRASTRSNGADHQSVGNLLATLTGRFHQKKNLPMLITDETAVMLTDAGWLPPFAPTDQGLSHHD